MIYEFEGHRPEIHPTAWIAPDAVLIGKVIVGAHASVWFGVVARGDNEPIVIGAGTNVQEHCVMHTDMGAPLTIGADCTIGHKAMLHGCTIGASSLIGMSATVLNHARIGAGCLIGAGALVTEGKEIADFSLAMGSPARVVRELDEAGRQRLLKSAGDYRAKAARFAAGLRQV